MAVSVSSGYPVITQSRSPASAAGVPFIIYASGIDGLATGNTALLTVPTGYSFVCDNMVVRLTTVTGSATTGHVSLINSTDTVDVIADTTLTSLTLAGLFTKINPAAAAPLVAAAKVLSFKVGTAYSVATVVTMSVEVKGYLIVAGS